jgi:hypothetical protein
MRLKMAKVSCCICLEDKFNKTTKCRSDCIYCQTTYCRQCLKQYLATMTDNIQCANCKKIWTDENLAAILPKTYVEKEIRSMRTKLLNDKERQLFPDTMPAAIQYQQNKNKLEDCKDKIKELEIQLRELRFVQSNYQTRMLHILHGGNDEGVNDDDDDDDNREREDDDLNEGDDLIDNINRERQGEREKKEKEKFFKPCPKEDCNGFLSTRWKCGICDTKVCKECLEIINVNNRDQHTCKPEDLASALEVKKNCKDCPKCKTKIFRVSGCSQMWCVKCHTPFNWNTGKIETGNVHNPHYYEWMHQNGQNNANQNDEINLGECGHIDATQLSRHLRSIRAPNQIQDKFLDVHRHIIEAQQILTTDLVLPNLEMRNRELRIKLIVNELPTEEYERLLFLNEKKYLSCKDFRDLYTVLVESGMGILLEFLQGNDYVTHDLRLDELNTFFAKQLQALNGKYKTKRSFTLYSTMYDPKNQTGMYSSSSSSSSSSTPQTIITPIAPIPTRRTRPHVITPPVITPPVITPLIDNHPAITPSVDTQRVGPPAIRRRRVQQIPISNEDEHE